MLGLIHFVDWINFIVYYIYLPISYNLSKNFFKSNQIKTNASLAVHNEAENLYIPI